MNTNVKIYTCIGTYLKIRQKEFLNHEVISLSHIQKIFFMTGSFLLYNNGRVLQHMPPPPPITNQ